MTVIAAGFDGGMPKRRDEGNVLRREPPAADPGADPSRPPSRSRRRRRRQRASDRAGAGRRRRSGRRAAIARRCQPTQQPPRRPRQVQFDDDDLDVPDFLK